MFKTPKNFGAVLWNGIYFKLELGANGFRGEPQAIDLNLIAAPPDKLDTPPYGIGERNPIEKGFSPQSAAIPVTSSAVVWLVRAAKSINDALRSQSGPVIPAGQASSTGAGNSSV